MSSNFSQNTLGQQTLSQLVNCKPLGTKGSYDFVLAIMQAEIDPQLVAANLIAWRMKGEDEQEILGAAKAMRELSVKLSLPLDEQPVVDIVGTGGDGANLFNVSTAACFVVAACGGRVAKHCGRGVSTLSGSMDLLSNIGIKSNATIEEQQERFAKTGLVFMFAPNHHLAMRHAAPIRQLIKQRTIFNLLGPLTNPAQVKRYLLGVYHPDLLEPMANILKQLGAERALVVHSEDGLDEISIAAPTKVCELNHGEVSSYTITPSKLGVSGSLKNCTVQTPEQSFKVIQQAFAGDNCDAAQQIAVNAGAGLYLLELADNIAEGVAIALNTMQNTQIIPA